MTKTSTNAVMPEQLGLLEEKIFSTHSIQEVIDHQHLMYSDFICSDAAEDTFLRQEVTVSHRATIKLLVSVQSKQDPDDNLVLCISI